MILEFQFSDEVLDADGGSCNNFTLCKIVDEKYQA